MPKILITGGAGFIGRHCVKKFLENKWDVVVLDKNPPLNFTEFFPQSNLQVHVGDVCLESDIGKSIANCDAVLHLAAQISVQYSMNFPDETKHVNVIGTNSVLSQCLDNNISKSVFASSAAVYGDNENLPLHEESNLHCLSPYAVSKLENEKQVSDYRKRGLNAVCLRFFNVYGGYYNGESDSVIPRLIRTISNKQAPEIFGDGVQTRDFIHVHDVANAIFKLFNTVETFPHDVINICSSTQTSISELLTIINEKMIETGRIETPIEPIFKPHREGDILHSLGSNHRIKSLIGDFLKTNINDGIEDSVQKYDIKN